MSKAWTYQVPPDLMANPTEYKTVQSRILAYAQEIGWKYVQRAEAERRRGFDPDAATPQDRARLAHKGPSSRRA
jgi:hypothetical protein